MNKKRRRPYARRLPAQFSRRVMLCVRVSKEVKTAIAKLASDRNMSSSEYAYKMITTHLAAAAQQGLLT